MLRPASMRPLKSRFLTRSFSTSLKPNLERKASSSRLKAPRSLAEESASHILFSRLPRRERRRSKMEVSAICFRRSRLGFAALDPVRHGGAPTLAVGVHLARGLGVGNRADDGADLHLHMRLDGGLLRAAAFLAPDEGHFGAGLGVLGVEHGDG